MRVSSAEGTGFAVKSTRQSMEASRAPFRRLMNHLGNHS